MKTAIIGMDPGQSGGIAFLSDDEQYAIKMPETDMDLLNLIQEATNKWHCTAWLEQVHSMPGQGVASSFKFGEGFGKLQMLLTCLHIPYHRVTPQKWQKAMGCMTKGDKNVSKRRAQELFPDIKCTHAVADALLIAEYGRTVSKQP